MKRTIWYLSLATLLFFQASIESQAQGKEEVTLKSVIQRLKKESGIQVSYESSAIKGVRVSINKGSKDLKQSLKEALPENLVLEEVAGRLIIKPLSAGVQPFYISIIECESGTSLPFATVSMISQSRGKVADQNGRVTFYKEVTSNEKFKVSFLGYQESEFVIGQLQPNGLNEVCLKVTPAVLDEVVVKGSNFNTFQVYSETGRIALGTNNINSFPVLGEADVFRNIQMLPGIQASGENASTITVRSNDSYQNLVLFDGFSLFHLDHFLGVFSTFNPHVVKGVEVYKGVFPGEYGGRTASVINVIGKGDTDGDEAVISVNGMAVNVMAHASLGKKADFLIAFRRSLTDIIQSGVQKEVFDKALSSGIEKINPGDPLSYDGDPIFKFYDLHSKLSVDLGSKTKAGVSFFKSEDELDLITGEYFEDSYDFTSRDLVSWENMGVQATLSHQIDLNRSIELQAGKSSFKSLADFEDEFMDDFEPYEVDLDSGYSDNDISETTIKLNYTQEISPLLTAKLGMFYSSTSTDFNSVIDNEFIDFESSNFIDYGVYGDWTLKTQKLNLNGGVRIHQYTGNQKTYLEPSINMSYLLNGQLHFKAGFRLSHQYLHQVKNEWSWSVTPTSWLLAGGDANLPIQQSANFQMGIGWQKDEWSIDLESYFFQTKGVISYIASLNNINARENSFDQWRFSGDRRGVGAEILTQYSKDAFEGWLSYTLSKSDSRFQEVKQGSWFASTLDQRHEVTGTALYQIKAWKFGLTGIFATGKPYTDLNAIDGELLDDFIAPVNNINEVRLPGYQRVDLTVGYKVDFGATDMELGISIFNLFGRENIKSRIYRQYSYDDEGSELDDSVFIPADLKLLGFTPNIFAKFHFKK